MNEAILYIIGGIFLALVLLSLYRRREAIGKRLKWLFVSIGGYFLAILIVRQFTQDPVRILLAAIIVELVIAVRLRPSRSRYISRSERRKVIARYERTGKKYDPHRHHIDHVVPYSRGGGSTADNLRVLGKDKNLAKSAKVPWWDVFGS